MDGEGEKALRTRQLLVNAAVAVVALAPVIDGKRVEASVAWALEKHSPRE